VLEADSRRDVDEWVAFISACAASEAQILAFDAPGPAQPRQRIDTLPTASVVPKRKKKDRKQRAASTLTGKQSERVPTHARTHARTHGQSTRSPCSRADGRRVQVREELSRTPPPRSSPEPSHSASRVSPQPESEARHEAPDREPGPKCGPARARMDGWHARADAAVGAAGISASAFWKRWTATWRRTRLSNARRAGAAPPRAAGG
jgi:hypothetical protein